MITISTQKHYNTKIVMDSIMDKNEKENQATKLLSDWTQTNWHPGVSYLIHLGWIVAGICALAFIITLIGLGGCSLEHSDSAHHCSSFDAWVYAALGSLCVGIISLILSCVCICCCSRNLPTPIIDGNHRGIGCIV